MHICVTQPQWVNEFSVPVCVSVHLSIQTCLFSFFCFIFLQVCSSCVPNVWRKQQGWFCLINSLASGKFEWNFRHVIFKQILVIDGYGISCEIALIWMSLDFTDEQSTLLQVMAWCHQATSHYLSHCWSLSIYGVTRPQWVLINTVYSKIFLIFCNFSTLKWYRSSESWWMISHMISAMIFLQLIWKNQGPV